MQGTDEVLNEDQLNYSWLRAQLVREFSLRGWDMSEPDEESEFFSWGRFIVWTYPDSAAEMSGEVHVFRFRSSLARCRYSARSGEVTVDEPEVIDFASVEEAASFIDDHAAFATAAQAIELRAGGSPNGGDRSGLPTPSRALTNRADGSPDLGDFELGLYSLFRAQFVRNFTTRGWELLLSDRVGESFRCGWWLVFIEPSDDPSATMQGMIKVLRFGSLDSARTWGHRMGGAETDKPDVDRTFSTVSEADTFIHPDENRREG